jgi:hypothetical protein
VWRWMLNGLEYLRAGLRAAGVKKVRAYNIYVRSRGSSSFQSSLLLLQKLCRYEIEFVLEKQSLEKRNKERG